MRHYVQLFISLLREYDQGSWQANVRLVFNSSIVKNAVSLYGVKAVNLLFPVITIPYVARVLGAAEWGKVVFAKSFAVWVGLIIEYGFRLSATREIAENRSDSAKIRKLVSQVVGGQLILLSICIPTSFLGLAFVPLFGDNPLLFAAALIMVVGKGIDPIWYFQGIEKLKRFSILTVAVRVLVVISIFVFVRTSEHAVRLMTIQATGYFIIAFVSVNWMYQKVSFSWPSMSVAVDGLREGWSMFIYRSSSGIFKTANSFILGLFASSEVVGLFGAAEKITKAALGLLNPISQSIYPRINNLISTDKEKAKIASVASMVVMGVIGVGLAVSVLLLGPFAIRLLLGAEYVGAVPALRVFAVMIPVMALSNSVGLHRMLPLRMDYSFNWIFVSAGTINVVLAAIIAPLFGAVGMAIVVLIVETFVLVSMMVVLRTWGGSSKEVAYPPEG